MKVWDDMNDFQVYHNYRVLVKRGWAEPYIHNNCGETPVPKIGLADNLYFKCFTCNVSIIPGKAQIDKFRQALKEFYK